MWVYVYCINCINTLRPTPCPLLQRRRHTRLVNTLLRSCDVVIHDVNLYGTAVDEKYRQRRPCVAQLTTHLARIMFITTMVAFANSIEQDPTAQNVHRTCHLIRLMLFPVRIAEQKHMVKNSKHRSRSDPVLRRN